jgi:hypothetical protein
VPEDAAALIGTNGPLIHRARPGQQHHADQQRQADEDMREVDPGDPEVVRKLLTAADPDSSTQQQRPFEHLDDDESDTTARSDD